MDKNSHSKEDEYIRNGNVEKEMNELMTRFNIEKEEIFHDYS